MSEDPEEIYIYLTKDRRVILSNSFFISDTIKLYDVVSTWPEAEAVGRKIRTTNYTEPGKKPAPVYKGGKDAEKRLDFV